MRKSKWLKEKKNIEKAKNEGKDYLGVARMYGVTRQRIHQVCRFLDVRIPRVAEKNRKAIVTLYYLGVSSPELGSMFDCSSVTILNTLKSQGVERRRPGRRRTVDKQKILKTLEALRSPK